ncbi:MAG: xanthine dehydrogenase family protein molybdopterin-binding subunit [Betaproteobacteria bacterium]|nr:MAG: xanthine dehydrogenase family protein molybdopterin-binding subunit [Betaproteobacteria bacterium]
MGFVGRSVTRLEDAPMLTGRGRYAADVSFSRELHMRVVRSSHAHARIVAIDAGAARELPGCVAVWTSEDVAEIPPIDFRSTRVQGLEPHRQPVLARDRVRYVGEPVAVVFAEDPYLAEDAADLVTMEVEELPVVLSADRGTEAAVIRKGYGDIEAAFRAAHTVVDLDLSIGRHSGVPLETRGAIARYDAMRDALELHGATKRPHANRDLLARMLAREPGSIHLYEGHVGGGFGVRGEIYPEDVLVCAAALRLGRPVKWIEDRRENLMACNHSREQRHRVRAAVDAQGRILGIDDEFFHDQGAYVRTHGARVADLTAGMLPGPYRVPTYRAVGHYRLTNKTPAATYRAPGRYEATFVCERLLDAIAAKTGIDRVEVRRRNLIAKTEMPYARDLDVIDTEVVLDSGDYAGLLDQALARADWAVLQSELEQRRAAGEAVGVGLAFFLEKSGLGPVDVARVSMAADGTFDVVTGAASLGQGVETVLAQIAADALGVDYRRVRVAHGCTDRIEQGYGSHASRTTVMTGSAVHIAATKLRENMQPGCSAQGSFESEHMTYPYGVHIAVVNVDRDTGGVAVERYLAAFDVGRAVNPRLVEGQIEGGVVQGLGGALLEEFVYDAEGSPLSVTFADYAMPTACEAPGIAVLLTEDAPSPLNPLGIKGAGEGGVNPVGAVIASAIDDALGVAGAVTRLPVTPPRLVEIMRAERR